MGQRAEGCIELVIWLDIASHKGGDWSEDPKSEGLWPMYTVGWVTDETDRAITMHSSVGDPRRAPCYGHDTVIPKGAIVERRVLRKHWALKTIP